MIAKFRLDQLTKYSWNVNQVEARFQAVKSEPFGTATPSGEMRMTIANPAAIAFLELGAEYEVTFRKITQE